MQRRCADENLIFLRGANLVDLLFRCSFDDLLVLVVKAMIK